MTTDCDRGSVMTERAHIKHDDDSGWSYRIVQYEDGSLRLGHTDRHADHHTRHHCSVKTGRHCK